MYFETIETEIAFELISLQIALIKFNSYVQRLYLTIEKTTLILNPHDAISLAFDYKKVIRLNWRFKNYCMDYLTEKQSDFFGNICDDIIRTYDDLIEVERLNGGNLQIATSFAFSSDTEYDYNKFNNNGNELKVDKLKEF